MNLTRTLSDGFSAALEKTGFMIGALFDNSTLPLLEKLAVFGERRQEVIAGNIANIDTPNYKQRDLPVEQFQEALRAAIDQRTQLTAGAAPQVAASLEDLFPQELFQPMEAAPNNITFHDGNNRSVESQVMEMTKNSMMQNFAIELMTAQMNLLQAVISERA